MPWHVVLQPGNDSGEQLRTCPQPSCSDMCTCYFNSCVFSCGHGTVVPASCLLNASLHNAVKHYEMLQSDKYTSAVFFTQAGHNASLTIMPKVGGCPTGGWVEMLCVWKPSQQGPTQSISFNQPSTSLATAAWLGPSLPDDADVLESSQFTSGYSTASIVMHAEYPASPSQPCILPHIVV
jgi:hypothetical protein